MKQGMRVFWGGCLGIAEAIGLLLWSSAVSANTVAASLMRPETIAAQETSLGEAICRQQWQNAIEWATNLISIPQISPSQRQHYVDLRHSLEETQSRAQTPNFLVNFEDSRWLGIVSADRCQAIQEKVQANTALPPVLSDPAIQWQRVVDRHEEIYH